MERRNFVYEQISAENLISTDLQREALKYPTLEAYRVTLLNPSGYQSKTEHLEALYSHETHRMGVAWGSDATWADVEGVEEGIDMYLNSEIWNDRN